MVMQCGRGTRAEVNRAVRWERSERWIAEVRRRWLPIQADVVLALVIAVNLFGVVVLDAGKKCVEQLDELCGGLIAEARQQEGQDDGVAFHWTSSRAVWTCSMVICRTLVRAAAESA